MPGKNACDGSLSARLVGNDAILSALIGEPFVVERPERQTVPFVFASPHSGRVYPPSFIKASKLDPTALRGSEDAFVDELFACAFSLGAPLIAARFPRTLVDANRAANEIDSSMFDVLPALSMGPRTARMAAGFGVVPRVVRDGAEIYAGPLPAREAVFRLEAFYRPYHAALARLVAETIANFGMAVVVDCHSMPSAAHAPDIVIGDRYGETAAEPFIAHARDCMRALGLSVGYNVPYAGGHTTLLYGRPHEGLQAFQVEINRGLYLDETGIEKLPAFVDCKSKMERFVKHLVAADPVIFMSTSKRERA